MGGGPGSGATQTQNQLTQQELAISQQQQTNANQLFQLSLPGFQTAENYYSQLASGNPSAIFSATAPAVGAINTASQGAAQQIAQNMPRGGAEQLAQAQLQQQRAGQVGNLQTQAYTGAFPALASLASGGLGLSANTIANAISAGSAGASSNAELMQAQAQGKGATTGLLGSLAQAGGTIGGSEAGAKGLESAAAAGLAI
jgi:hypothetical protein